MRLRALAAVAPFALLACTARETEPDDPPAQRADVIAALYRQLDLTIARYEEIEEDPGPAAASEREELSARAHAIALKIVRVDPDADVQTLTARVERVR
jgi:hypothetical protein